MKLLLTVVLLSLSNFVFGIDSYEQKYWSYRARLLDRFVLVGEPPSTCDDIGGYSVPISIYSEKTIQVDNANRNVIKFQAGDAPKDLAWYIGVLATEFRLLKNSGKSTETTKKELYYAMRAMERLDKKAETYSYPQHFPPVDPNRCSNQTLNGFLTRSDAGYGYFRELVNQKYKDFPDAVYVVNTKTDYDNPENRAILFNIGDSEFTAPDNGYYGSKRNFYSKDHMAHLLMGLALVKRYVGESYFGYNLNQEAINAAKRMIDFAQSSDWNMKIPTPMNNSTIVI